MSLFTRYLRAARMVTTPKRYPRGSFYRRSAPNRFVRLGLWHIYKRLPGLPSLSLKLPNGRSFRAHPRCEVSHDIFILGGHHFYEVSFLRQHLSGGGVSDRYRRQRRLDLVAPR